MNTSRRAARKLNEKLIGMFYAEDIGFRVINSFDEPYKIITIKLDKRCPGDEVIEINGVKILLDPVSAAALKNCELDYSTAPETGFLIKRCRVKSPSLS